MNFLLQITAIFCPVFIALSFFLYRALKRTSQFEVRHAALAAQTEALKQDADEVRALRQQNSEYLELKSIAETQKHETEKKLQAALAERNEFLQQKDAALARQAETEQRLALMQQHVADVEKTMKDWEVMREESKKAATASVMEAGGILSNKLLEDHKREAEAAKKEAEEAAKKNAESLIEQMLTITNTVASLKEQNGQAQQKLSTIWRSLTTPAGAGQLAEIGLENSLKNLALEAGRDYIMQSVQAGGLRPDAVVLLPQNMVMVIDCKASKFLLEIAEAESAGTSEAELLQGLARTMNKHLQDLKTKSYESAIGDTYREAGRSSAIAAIQTVMYVPSESAIDQIKRADPEFMGKAQRSSIIIASPTSLQGLLSLARYNIGQQRQSENHDVIIKNVQQLMDNVISMLSHAEKVGKGIKSAADSYDQFSRSVNRNILSKMGQLASLGIKSAKNKEAPKRITSFEVRATEDMLTIEGEAELVDDAQAIEDFSKQKLSA